MNRGKFAPVGRGRPEAAVWQIFAAPLGRVIWGELRLRHLDAGEKIPPRGEIMSIISWSLLKPLKFEDDPRRSFLPGSPSSLEEKDVPAKHTYVKFYI
jgi:hypothetical protein